MLKTILPLVLLSACAVPTYVTKHGIKVYDSTTVITPSQHEVEEVTKYVLRHIQEAHKLKGSKLMLVNKWIQIPNFNDDGYKLADGLTNPFDRAVIVSVFQTCFADSGFPHELAHLMHNYPIPDWGHKDKEYWATIKQLEKDIVRDLCPEGYVHTDIPPDYVPSK